MINTWLSQLSSDILFFFTEEQVLYLRVCFWVTWSWVGVVLLIPPLFFVTIWQTGWMETSAEQWVTTMLRISQPGCAFLAPQRNPVHSSTHTDALSVVCGGPALLVFTGPDLRQNELFQALESHCSQWRINIKRTHTTLQIPGGQLKWNFA